MKPGPTNSLTDVAGLKVGQAEDPKLRTGVSIVVPDEPCVAAVDVRGGGPGTRETDVLAPGQLGVPVHAVVLSGGSAFGLDAAGAIANALSAKGVGYRVGERTPPIPIVPAAILFDLAHGDPGAWGPEPPYRRLGLAALAAIGTKVVQGSVGAGAGATCGAQKGGIGTASLMLDFGVTVGALVAVNAVGSALVPGTGTYWAAPFAFPEDGLPAGVIRHGMAREPWPEDAKGTPGARQNTTLAVIACNADLTKEEAMRIAVMAQTGLARAIRPAHTPFDGDTVFSLATGRAKLSGNRQALTAIIGAAAADVLARAIARGIHHAFTP